MIRLILKLLILFPFSIGAQAKLSPLPDNVLFGFEKCKTWDIDLLKGQIKESVNSSFDLHCQKVEGAPNDLRCAFFDPGSNKKSLESVFTGGSDLGVAELKDPAGRKIKFLIGKKYASYDSSEERRVCVGIFIFEKDALRQKASSLKSGL